MKRICAYNIYACVDNRCRGGCASARKCVLGAVMCRHARALIIVAKGRIIARMMSGMKHRRRNDLPCRKCLHSILLPACVRHIETGIISGCHAPSPSDNRLASLSIFSNSAPSWHYSIIPFLVRRKRHRRRALYTSATLML